MEQLLGRDAWMHSKDIPPGINGAPVSKQQRRYATLLLPCLPSTYLDAEGRQLQPECISQVVHRGLAAGVDTVPGACYQAHDGAHLQHSGWG